MLFIGEEVGRCKGRPDGVGVDIAVDPLEGTNLCATGAPDATAVLAAAERGGLLHAPDSHMQKIIVGPTAKGRIHIDAPVIENLRALAKAFARDIEDLTIVVLDRPRHEQLITDIRDRRRPHPPDRRRRPVGRHRRGGPRHRRARGASAPAARPRA